MPPPQGVNGVEEDEVTWGNQEEEHTGRARVHSWKREMIYFQTSHILKETKHRTDAGTKTQNEGGATTSW